MVTTGFPARLRRAALATGAAFCLALGSPVPAAADPGDPTEDVGHKAPDAGSGGKSGTFLDDLFSASKPAMARFERPSGGYDALMAKRSTSLLLARSRGYGLLPEPTTETYLNQLLRRITDASGFGDLDVRVYMHSDRAISAVTSPDGAIYVNHGLLANLQNEAELAFLLSHELAHFLYRHHDSDWFVDSQHNLLTSVEKMKEVSRELSGFLRQNGNPLGDKLQKASQIGAVVFDLSSVVVSPAWGREQEEEADFLGIDLMVAAGYNPYYANDLLKLIGDYEEKLRETAGAAGGALGLRSLEAFGILNEENANNPLVQQIAHGFGTMISEISSDHYPADERIEAVNKYIAKFHESYPEDEPADVPWLGNPKHPVPAIDARYADAELAQEKLKAGDLKAAAALAAKALDRLTQNHAFPRLVFFDVRRQQGDLRNAGKNLEIALTAPEPALMIYEMRLDLEEEAGRWKNALAIVGEAESAVGETPSLLPHKILALQALGQRQKAGTLVTTCQYEYRALSASCTEAAEGKRPRAPPIDRGKSRGKTQRATSFGGKPAVLFPRRS